MAGLFHVPPARIRDMTDHRPDFQTLITTARSGVLHARSDAVEQLVQYGRRAEAPLVALLADPSGSEDKFAIVQALEKVGVKHTASVDILVGLLNLESHRWRVADLLLHTSPNIRRHLPDIQSVLQHETEPRVKEILQKLLDRYPTFSAKSPPAVANQADESSGH